MCVCVCVFVCVCLYIHLSPPEVLCPMKSWIEVSEDSEFPLHNIPFGVFRPAPEDAPRCATRVGNTVVDLSVLADAGLICKGGALEGHEKCFSEGALNTFMGLGRPAWLQVREELQELLSEECASLRDEEALRARALYPVGSVIMELPAHIGDYTDCYASREHATNLGTMMRGAANALQENWTWIPVGYHGRASSVVVSGTPLRRPCGQLKPEEGDPTYGPCRLADFELEVGAFVGTGNPLGEPITIEDAPNHIFGLVLLNDWSARDIQKWEYVPLGPFGAKNWGTTISPWVVTLDALQPFTQPGPVQEPAPLPYLKESFPSAFNIQLEVQLQSEAMEAPHTVTTSNMKYMYWSIFQQLAHHTVTGCNMRPGDLVGTGTLSGPSEGEYGSMIELSWRGTRSVPLPNGEERKFLQDGDTVFLKGYCQGEDYRIGFGECVGQLLPAAPQQH